jgi:hypothetical protein
MPAPSTIVNIRASFPAGSTPVYTGQIVDGAGVGIPALDLNTLILSIVDTARATIINGVNQVNILNNNRGTVDALGNLTISLQKGDTSMLTTPTLLSVTRSLVIEWTYNGGASEGRHQVNFGLLALVGEPE